MCPFLRLVVTLIGVNRIGLLPVVTSGHRLAPVTAKSYLSEILFIESRRTVIAIAPLVRGGESEIVAREAPAGRDEHMLTK
jgi:hypothetical protein